MEWNQVIADPFLQNLPYKIELNQWGKIVLSPVSNKQGLLQAELAGFLRNAKKNGKVITECSVNTHKGVKVADIVWESDDFFRRNALDTPYQEAPELCIEILSPSNSRQELKKKSTYICPKALKKCGFVMKTD